MSSAALEQDEGQTGTNDQWSMAQAEKNGKPLLIRFRSQRPQGVKAASFPCLLSATWSYQRNEYGLPSPEEMELMDKFEDALASSLEDSQTAHLMVVLTNDGERDWLWYTCSEDEAMSRVNQALKGHKRYPVEFSAQNDQAWSAWAQFETGNGSLPHDSGTLIGWAFAKIMQLFGR